MHAFIVFEGICCSGKTTLCNRLKDILEEKEFRCIYNHGSMTYTPIGREFYDITSTMAPGVGSVYYFLDLIINTRDFIVPTLNGIDTIILQDRYYDAITTYTKAYGDFFHVNNDIYRAADVLLENDYLLHPSIQVFCIPAYEIIVERMKNSKQTKVHDFYKRHPDFLKAVYYELKSQAERTPNAIIIDTTSDSSTKLGIGEIISRISLL